MPDGDQVSITAEAKREKEDKQGEKVLHTEPCHGRQFRSFTLGRDIDRKKVGSRLFSRATRSTRSPPPARRRPVAR